VERSTPGARRAGAASGTLRDRLAAAQTEIGHLRAEVGGLRDATPAHSTQMAALLDVVAELAPATATVDVCHIAGAAVKGLVPEATVVTSYLDVAAGRFCLADVLGAERYLTVVERLIGRDPLSLGCTALEAPAHLVALYTDGRLHAIPGGLGELARGLLPGPAAHGIEKVLGVGPVHVVGLAWEGRYYGGITLLLPLDADLLDRIDTIEAIARQASIALQRSFSMQAHLESEARLQASADRLRAALEATVAAMGAVMLTRDPYTDAHQRRVTALSVATARKMGLSGHDVDAVRLAGGIHDIGKVGIPAEILSRPGPLSDAEYELVREHPQVGHDILSSIEFDWPLADIVLQHHERLDGSGYPKGLKCDEVLPAAQVLAVADVVEAMTSHRPYRPALGMEAALAEVQSGRGVRYAPAAVDACVSVVRDDGFTLPD
jgi:putative nucleotidyltransferase with HDIG domain